MPRMDYDDLPTQPERFNGRHWMPEYYTGKRNISDDERDYYTSEWAAYFTLKSEGKATAYLISKCSDQTLEDVSKYFEDKIERTLMKLKYYHYMLETARNGHEEIASRARHRIECLEKGASPNYFYPDQHQL